MSMTTRTTWEALAARCREAITRNILLDGDITLLADQIPAGYTRRDSITWIYPVPPFIQLVYSAKPLTTSIDAIVSLIEKTLPRTLWQTSSRTPMIATPFKAEATIYPLDSASFIEELAATPALALCAAYCIARAGMEDDAQ